MKTWLNRSDHFTKSPDRDDPYVRDECTETRLNRPDRLTKNSVTETILTSETIILKPGFSSISCAIFLCFPHEEPLGVDRLTLGEGRWENWLVHEFFFSHWPVVQAIFLGQSVHCFMAIRVA